MNTPMKLNAATSRSHTTHTDAASVHASSLVIDSHADTPQRLVDQNFDLDDPLGNGQWSLPTARKGNLGAEFFSIWVDPDQYRGHEVQRALELDVVHGDHPQP